MKKKTLIASTITVSALTASYQLINHFTKKLLYREKLDKDSQNDWYQELNGKKISIENENKLMIQGYLFEEENAQRTIIGLHALDQSSCSLKETVSYLKEMIPQSNVLLYDAHAHGLSDGYVRKFGYEDVEDLVNVQSYVLETWGDQHQIIYYGQGMGANTVLNASGRGLLKNTALILSEGAYTDVYQYLGKRIIKELNIPYFMTAPIIRIIINVEVKKDIKEMDTIQWIKKNEIPTVYIHSKEDRDAPFEMVFPLYNKNASEKFLFPLKHGGLIDHHDFTDSYLSSLKEFVEKYFNEK